MLNSFQVTYWLQVMGSTLSTPVGREMVWAPAWGRRTATSWLLQPSLDSGPAMDMFSQVITLMITLFQCTWSWSAPAVPYDLLLAHLSLTQFCISYFQSHLLNTRIHCLKSVGCIQLSLIGIFAPHLSYFMTPCCHTS